MIFNVIRVQIIYQSILTVVDVNCDFKTRLIICSSSYMFCTFVSNLLVAAQAICSCSARKLV